MKIALIISLVFLYNSDNAQTAKDSAEYKVKAGYGLAVEQTQPEFPGGRDSLSLFLKTTLHYPKQSLHEGVHGKVWLGFLVDHDGNIKDESILKSVNKELDTEALRILKLMPPWKPATIGGNPVNSQYILQIEFIPPGQK